MGLFGWFRKQAEGSSEDPRLKQWRARWRAAVENGNGGGADELGRELHALALSEEDVEIEREMLDGLQALGRLALTVETSGMPVVPTGHRVVGSDTCHEAALASMPDEPGQPAGRLLLTSARAIFIGGGTSTAVPWHAVSQVVQDERDLLLIRGDRQRVYRFRCNAYADALCGAFLSRRLVAARRRPAPGL